MNINTDVCLHYLPGTEDGKNQPVSRIELATRKVTGPRQQRLDHEKPEEGQRRVNPPRRETQLLPAYTTRWQQV